MPPAPEERKRKKFGSEKERIKERALLVAALERRGLQFRTTIWKKFLVWRVFSSARLLLRRRQLKLR